MEIDKDTAKKITDDSYVDDNLSGGSKEEVDCMIGEVNKSENGSLEYSGTVSQILSRVLLTPKVIVRSGESDTEALDKLGGRVLGHTWDAEKDLISFNLQVNIIPKLRNMRTGPALTIKTLVEVEN